MAFPNVYNAGGLNQLAQNSQTFQDWRASHPMFSQHSAIPQMPQNSIVPQIPQAIQDWRNARPQIPQAIQDWRNARPTNQEAMQDWIASRPEGMQDYRQTMQDWIASRPNHQWQQPVNTSPFVNQQLLQSLPPELQTMYQQWKDTGVRPNIQSVLNLINNNSNLEQLKNRVTRYLQRY